MKSYILAISLLVTLPLSKSLVVPEEEGILLLDSANFIIALKIHKILLVNFFASWCQHCKAFEPIFSELGQTMINHKFKTRLAKIEGSQNQEISAQFQVNSFPTLKLFFNGKAIDYSGRKNKSEILHWINSKFESLPRPLSNQKEIDDLMSDKPSLVYFFPDGDEKANDILELVSLDVEGIDIYYSHEKELITRFKSRISEYTLVMFRSFDNGPKIFSSEYLSSSEKIKDFVETYRHPAVRYPSKDLLDQIKTSKKPIFIFISENSDSSDKEKTFRDFAEENVDEFVFVRVDLDEQRLGKEIDLSFLQEEKNRLGILHFKKGELRKYKCEDLSIEDCAEDFMAGKLKRFLESDPSTNHLIKDLRVDVLNDMIIKSDQNILLYLYSKNCDECEKGLRVFESLAQSFSKFEEILFAKINISSNEIKETPIDKVPSVRLYKIGYKHIPFDYMEEVALEGLKTFLANEIGIKENPKDTEL